MLIKVSLMPMFFSILIKVSPHLKVAGPPTDANAD